MLFLSLHHAEQTIQTMCVQQGWQVGLGEWEQFCRDVYHYWQRGEITSVEMAQSVMSNYYHDRQRVAIALDPRHPQHNEVWASINSEIVTWLERRRYYPPDETTLNEYSPDICAYAMLREHLKDFRFGCRLSTFIQVVTERACRQWLRSLAARKRGGAGITTGAQRRCADPNRQTAHQRLCYLSQSPSFDPSVRWEEIIPNDDFDLVGIAESHALVQQVEAAVLAMTDDRLASLIPYVWRPLLLERANIGALAEQCGVSKNVVFNLKKRLIRQIRPILAAWRTNE